MLRFARHTPFMLLTIAFICPCLGQTKAAKSSSTKTSSKAPPSESAPGATVQNTESSASGLTNAVLEQAPTPGADYIPCKFTYNELQSLVEPERKLTLSPADAEKLVQSVVTEIENQQSAGLLDAATAQDLLSGLNSEEFVGLTPTQAISLIIRTVQIVRDAARVESDLSAAADTVVAASSSTASAKNRSDAAETAKSLASDAHLAAQSASNNMALGSYQALPYWLTTEIKNANTNADEVAAQAELADKAARSAATTSSNLYAYYPQNSSPSGKAAAVTAAAGQIVNQAQKSVNGLMRPVDVGCAMSVLSWGETNRAYGRIIANTYVAVQVVVRNLNREQQFMLHDAEFAVNIDPHGTIGRFYSGRDKVIVRQMAAAQESFDIRNLVVNSAESVGAILSATAIVYGGPVSDAANVYVSGFFPSLSKAWKDTSIDQLNLLNDTGFSSTTSSQVVVPKSGTVMFVTFIPSKQFEQGWWTFPCATRTYLGQIADVNHRELVPLTPADKAVGDENVAALGYDVEHAIESCVSNSGSGKHGIQELIGDDNENPPKKNYFIHEKPVVFKKWSGNSLAIFQELSTAVVAGMHILDESALESSVSQLSCDTDDTGKIKFPANDQGQLTCTATGKNLDKVKSLRLRNAHDPADPQSVDGALTLGGGDNTSGSVIFSTDALHKLPGADYTVFTVDKSGVESKTGLAVHLSTAPVVTKVQPTSLNLSDPTQTPKTITLTGYHLSGWTRLTIKSSNGSVDVQLAGTPVPTDTSLTFDSSKATWTKLGSTPGTAQLVLSNSNGGQTALTQSLPYSK